MADLVPVPVNVKPAVGTTTAGGVAGADIERGDLIYKDTTDNNRMKLADADVLASHRTAGIALNKAQADQPVTFLPPPDPSSSVAQDVTLGCALVPRMTYVASRTAGKICPVGDLAAFDGAYLSYVGYAIDATTLRRLPIAGTDVNYGTTTTTTTTT